MVAVLLINSLKIIGNLGGKEGVYSLLTKNHGGKEGNHSFFASGNKS